MEELGLCELEHPEEQSHPREIAGARIRAPAELVAGMDDKP